MQRPRKLDRDVRYCGAGLVVMAVLLVTQLHPHRAAPVGDGPTLAQFFMALIAVCAASTGASCLVVGRRLFEPVRQGRGRPLADSEPPVPRDRVARFGRGTRPRGGEAKGPLGTRP